MSCLIRATGSLAWIVAATKANPPQQSALLPLERGAGFLGAMKTTARKETTYPQPQIHLNGTGRKTLIAETKLARNSLMVAIKAFESMTCHGRDFYILDDSLALEKAAAKRHEMGLRFVELAKYIDARFTHLLDQ